MASGDAFGPSSWGRYPPVGQRALALAWTSDALPATSAPLLAYGMGRSYGDVCLNPAGPVLLTRELRRFLAFDVESGVLRCEAGCTLGEVAELGLPHGWFPPVVPGTRFVTVGGAVANDVHGKNHHRAGTFGRHVRALELLRGDGTRVVCGPSAQAELFSATVGGLGLTGLITWVEVQLSRVPGAWVSVEAVPFRTLGDFAELAADSDKTHAYTVAWVDGLARGEALGRGIFFRGNHAEGTGPLLAPRQRWTVPCGRARRAPLDARHAGLQRALPPLAATQAALRLGVEIPPPTGRHWLLEPAVRRARPLAAPKRRPWAGGRARAVWPARRRADRAPSSPC